MKQKPRWLRILILLGLILLIVFTQVYEQDSPTQPPGDGPLHWGNLNTLEDHFVRHGPALLSESAEHYARQARVFYLAREGYQVKTDTDGTIRVFDAETNTFGAYNADGSTRTFFKPSAGQAYFDRQPGE